MNFESSIVFRCVARIARLALAAGLLPAAAAVAQLPITFTPGNPPPVLSGSVVPFNHGATGEWNQIYSIRMAPNGTIVFLDSPNSEIYGLTPGASTPTLIAGAGTQGSGANDCTTMEASGTYWNAGISFDSANNLYFGNRYSSLAPFCRVPYDTATNTWNFKASAVWGPPTITQSGSQSVLNPQDIFIPACSSSCTKNTLYFSTSGAAGGNAIYEVTFNVSDGSIVGSPTPIISGLQALAASLVVDPAGNVYFTENIYPTPVTQRVSGVREIPAGTTNLVASGSGSEASLTQMVGNSGEFTGISGINVDAQGNLYFSSINNSGYFGYVDGVFMIPNEGTASSPNLNWNDTMMVSPVSAGHQVFVDPRGFLWIATGGNSNWAPTGTLAPTCDATSVQTADATCLESSVVVWKPGAGTIGSASASGSAQAQITGYSVPAAGGTLVLTANNSFTEGQVITFSVASSSDPLYPLNGLSLIVQGTSLSSTQFSVSTSAIAGGSSGTTTATASAIPYSTIYYTFNQATTPASFAFGQNASNFKVIGNPTPNTSITPAVQPCTAGTTYPAFTPTEETSGFPSSGYSWCSLFVQLSSTSVGSMANDVEMLDASKNLITGSNAYLGAIGQGAAISSLSAATPVGIGSGLNQPQQIAVDALGDTYVVDKALKAVEYYAAGTNTSTVGTVYGSGLTAPTGVAVDGAGDLYVADNGSVYEIPYYNGKLQSSQQTKIAGGLGTGNLSLAVDSMGDVFVADQANKQVAEIVNPESEILRQNLSAIQVVGSNASFNGPSAIATDSAGNVWVADGTDLWEITMPFGGASEISTNLPTGVTGMAVDPSGSVLVASASGLTWIPYQTSGTSAGLNINGAVQVIAGFGSGPAAPIGVALDKSQNIYADYGSGATAGLAELSVYGTLNFNNYYTEINPAVPYEVDAQLFNLGNMPLTLAAFYPNNGSDQISGSSDYSILQAATLNQPPCSSSTSVATGSSCFFGLQLLAPSANASDTATLTIASNAVNTPSASAGLTLGLSADVVTDPRPATQIQLVFAPNTSATGCNGSTYPGCETATVTVSSTAGTPGGTVTLRVPGSGLSQQLQTATLGSNGVATFNFTNLSGGTYNALVTYAGQGALTCSGAACFAGSAYSTTFTISQAIPVLTVGVPGKQGCMSWTQTNCSPNQSDVMLYLGTYFINQSSAIWFTAAINSPVGTPTGTVTFETNGQPVDPKQPTSSLVAGDLANFSLANLNTGTYSITAHYNGDQNFAPVDVVIPTFQVIVPSAEITASPATLTTKAGTAVQTTLNLMPLVGFSGDVTLKCLSASLPQYAECTFAYPNSGQGTIGVGQVNTTPPSTIVLTISTNVPVNSGTTTASAARHAPWALAGLFGFGLLGLIAGRKRCSRYLTMVCLAFLLSGVFLGLTSCTNAGYSTPPAAPKVATPTGTYQVQVISYNPTTLQQNSLANTPAYTLQLTVQ